MVRVLNRDGGGAGTTSRKPSANKDKESKRISQPNTSKKFTGKIAKRTNSDITKKRTAFGDLTNAAKSNGNTIPVAQISCEKNCASLKPQPKVAAAEKGKRRLSKRVKDSKLHSSISDLPNTIEDAIASPPNDDMSFTEQCDEILKSSSTSPAETEESVADVNVLPEGVDPFDDDPNPDYSCEYAESIFKNMRKREAKFPISNYLTGTEAKSTTPVMRAILIDWLVEVQENFQLYHETLYLAVKLVDAYLQHRDTPKERLQLVGATALLIACKIEERQPPPIDDFQYICDDAYTDNNFVDMEIEIFKTLNFDINIPISYRYLRRFSRVTLMSMEILTLGRFILELSLHAATFVHQPPSIMAAASLCLAMKMAKAGPWNANHCYHAGYEEEELQGIMKDLNEMLIECPESKLKTVQEKYSHPVHFSVAKTKPLPRDAFFI